LLVGSEHHTRGEQPNGDRESYFAVHKLSLFEGVKGPKRPNGPKKSAVPSWEKYLWIALDATTKCKIPKIALGREDFSLQGSEEGVKKSERERQGAIRSFGIPDRSLGSSQRVDE